MKLGILALPSLTSLALIAGCAAETPDENADSSTQDLVSATSAYTETSRVRPLDGCTKTQTRWDLSASRYDCGEMDGYTLVASTTDETALAPLVRTPSGTFALDLFRHGVSTKNGYLGKLAEWRGRGTSPGRVEPTALIVRYFTPGEAEVAEWFRGQNGLAVIKLTHDGVCVHSVVSGGVANHNQIARDIADSPAFQDYVCPGQTPEPNVARGCGVLQSNTGIAQGLENQYVRSCSNSHTLYMQDDGNLALYNNRTGRATWSSQTAGRGGTTAILRPDGQLSVFDEHFNAVFSTSSAGNAGASLAVQDDGNVVIYAKNGRPVWSTGTQGQ